MREFYKVTEYIKNAFLDDELVQTITHGAIVDLDINKKNIFPLVHLVVNSSQLLQGQCVFNFTIYVMDIRNINKKVSEDRFYKNDNELDILNTNHAICNRFITKLRLDQNDDDIRLINDPSIEAITADFTNILDGWSFNIDMAIPNNDISVC